MFIRLAVAAILLATFLVGCGGNKLPSAVPKTRILPVWIDQFGLEKMTEPGRFILKREVPFAIHVQRQDGVWDSEYIEKARNSSSLGYSLSWRTTSGEAIQLEPLRISRVTQDGSLLYDRYYQMRPRGFSQITIEVQKTAKYDIAVGPELTKQTVGYIEESVHLDLTFIP